MTKIMKNPRDQIYIYILEQNGVVCSYRDLSKALNIPLVTIFDNIRLLIDEGKIVVSHENNTTHFSLNRTPINDSTNTIIGVFNSIIGTVKKTLFRKELTTVDWEVIKILENYCVGDVENWKFSEFIINHVNENLGYKAIKNSMILRTQNMLRIKRSGVYTRVIDSHPSYGYGLPLEKDRNRVSFATKKNLNAIKTDIINGANINLYYSFMNELKGKYMKINKQGRLVFHTEKDHIMTYSDDLVKETLPFSNKS